MALMTTAIGVSGVRPMRLVVFGAAIVGVLAGINIAILHLSGDPLADVHAYYDAGARLNAGLPLYVQSATTNEAEFYRYPPLLAIAFRPLALLPFEAAAAIWETFVVLSLVTTVVVLRPDRGRLAIFGILFLPIMWSVTIGQAQVPVTMLVALGSPWAIALATHLKIFPGLVAIWWLGRRDWRSLGWFLAWLAVLGLVQLALEPAGSAAFLGVFNLSQVGDVRNLSPYAVSPLLWAALVAVAAGVALRLARGRWGWAAAVVLSVLASPRVLVYQLMTLVAATRAPDDPARRTRRRFRTPDAG